KLISNKFRWLYIIISIITILSAVLVSLVGNDPKYFLVSVIYILIISSFSIYYIYESFGKKGLVGLIFVAIFAYFIENMGIITGFPYGNFYYSSAMGPKIFHTPITLALAYVPLVIGAYVLCDFIKSKLYRILSMTGILLMFDLVIDPGAVKLGLWIWENPGIYYGIPFTNFLGWIFSGLIASAILVYMLNGLKPSKNLKYSIITSYYLMLFYTTICLMHLMLIPSILGIGIVAYLTSVLEFNYG
ncbi:MAG TPA: carotenoid biosynthesis protein, partial [Allocoleopsis sp.]